MLKGFREFINRGDVVDLSVGVVVGVAFTTLVGAFATGLIMPIVNILGGGDAGAILRSWFPARAWISHSLSAP